MRFDSPSAANGQTRLPATPAAVPDAAFAARPRLLFLRHALVAEAQRRPRPASGEPPVFFFDPVRQAEYEAARPPRPKFEAQPIEQLVADTLPALLASVEVRRAARVIPGLREAAAALTGRLPITRELAAILDVPDDEVVLVLHPARRAGIRLDVRGVADIGQFQILLANAVAGENGWLPRPSLPSRFAAACRDADPIIPAGVPMIAEPVWQLFQPAAVLADGSVPRGFTGCRHWLWPEQPLAAVERVDGERVILLGDPEVRAKWELERRFPQMPAELKVLEIIGPFAIAERLTRLAGRPVPVRAPETQPAREVARAA